MQTYIQCLSSLLSTISKAWLEDTGPEQELYAFMLEELREGHVLLEVKITRTFYNAKWGFCFQFSLQLSLNMSSLSFKDDLQFLAKPSKSFIPSKGL